MSPFLIGLLVAGGIIILLVIGYINQSLERARVQRARQSAELAARLRLLAQAQAQLPAAFLPAELRSQLQLVEIAMLEKLLRLDNKQEAASKRLELLRSSTADNDAPSQSGLQINNEEQSKELRAQLENLDKLMVQAASEGQINGNDLQRWQKHIRQCLLHTQLETFQSLARLAMQQGKPRVAKLQYERAVGFLSKLNSPALANKLAEFKAMQAQAEQAAIRAEQQGSNDSELLAGMQELEKQDETWKKKSVYDE